MRPGFPQTQSLNQDEKEILLPMVIRGLETKIGKRNQITAGLMAKRLTANLAINRPELSLKITDVVIRKLIHYIRTNDLIHCLVANGNGYWIEDDPAKVRTYIEGLRGRIASETAMADSLERQLESLKSARIPG